MKLLLMAATADELLALFPNELRQQIPPLQELFPLCLPKTIGKRDFELSLCLCGTGPVNAALATGCAVEILRAQGHDPDHVLLTGLTGAYDLRRMPLCTLCIVEKEIWPEYGLNEGHSVIAEAFKWPLWKKNENETVFDRIELDSLASFPSYSQKLCEKLSKVSSLTVAGVSASFERAQFLWDRYHADLENMEGFAVAYACARLGLPCTEIRSISNKTGPRRADEKDFTGALRALSDILPWLSIL